ncbi:3'-5' exonuclease [Cryobacterium roopkundense]|uniref:DNA-directed DNA polymerase n=1 Tax=Cryobacterium roopkundense TaxID=1001240 RepID=A0A099JDW9_9MICO|nr:bifunctional 3'-5' exonuclease/DNA polymerase [Cryobacterium roopkundense]KGJ75683.1 3'-5' exonuclease [Cryobacterium roopkundense]MBB5641137.1 DNA polymerase-1 [Cryobacterium roopkundense]
MYQLVSSAGPDGVIVTVLDRSGTPRGLPRTLSMQAFGRYVIEHERDRPRWVWEDTARLYPNLLRHSIRVQRCHDLRLCHVILRNSALTARSEIGRSKPGAWDAGVPLHLVDASGPTLFELMDGESPEGAEVSSRPLDEFLLQLRAVSDADQPGRIRLLLAAESAGALIAAEMTHAGLPWRSDIHHDLLTRELGDRVPPGVRPERLEALATRIRVELGDSLINPDSPTELLRALQRVGLAVTSTRAWTLKEVDHPVIEPLLLYKKLSRLLSANGWAWMESWISAGRFHPEYLPGGVVTGRWAARGGGALQLPKQIRGAVVADPGWKLVVADAAQLEPRILAALSADLSMAAAGRGTDLYAGIVASGVVESRDHAKVAMLGAMYGATTGESGRLLPRLAKAYPRAIGLTETAARAGERGDIVTTRLGRSSPPPQASWYDTQAQAYDSAASSLDESRARAQARDWGRFTRNFVVQGTAAEWALCWMAEIRRELQTLHDAGDGFRTAPHLVFFLHDEVIVHTPEGLADRVESIIIEAAATAGRLLFGDFPVDFMLTTATVDNYAEAK